MIGERMASKAMINKTMIDRIEMKQKLMQWRSALVLVTMLLMLPLQMLAENWERQASDSQRCRE